MTGPDQNARMVQDFETPQGKLSKGGFEFPRWDDLTPWGRAVIRGCVLVAACVVASGAALFFLHLFTVAAGNAADPLAGVPW